jgi:hypothetical protein
MTVNKKRVRTQETKKQHTVPRFYLKRFADQKERLFVYDKVTAKVFRANVSDVAERNRFYDLPAECFGLEPDAPYDPQFVEHTLAVREGVLERAMAEFLVDVEVETPIDLNHRFAISYFMVLQTLRTPFARMAMQEVRDRVLEHLATEEGPDCVAPGSPIYEQLNVPKHGWAQSQAAAMLNPVISAQAMAPLVERVWCIGINKTGRPLYTSDNPVVKYVDNPPRGMGVGFGSGGVEVSLPLSPEIVLLLADSRSAPAFASCEGRRLILNDDNVTFYNWLQISHSERQVFCSASDFAFADELCRERPHLRDPNRQRVWINEP